MNEQNYEDWRRRRARSDVPADFSDRVMAAIEAQKARRRRASLLLAALLGSRLSRLGLCSLAAATCAFRLWNVVAIFVAQ